MFKQSEESIIISNIVCALGKLLRQLHATENLQVVVPEVVLVLAILEDFVHLVITSH